VSTQTLQGWRPDPYGRYEERYFSGGIATRLVRTGRIEASDEPEGSLAPYSAPEPRPVVRTRVVDCVLVRRRPGRSRFILALTFLAVPVALALLTPDDSGRAIIVVIFAGAAAMLGLLIGGSSFWSGRSRSRRPA
jgi:hypothetical protein